MILKVVMLLFFPCKPSSPHGLALMETAWLPCAIDARATTESQPPGPVFGGVPVISFFVSESTTSEASENHSFYYRKAAVFIVENKLGVSMVHISPKFLQLDKFAHTLEPFVRIVSAPRAMREAVTQVSTSQHTCKASMEGESELWRLYSGGSVRAAA